MNILINASNLKTGGAVQVTDSICTNLTKFTQHKFIVVLSACFDILAQKLSNIPNVKIERYNIKNSFETLLFGRDKYLDSLVINENIDIVVSIFGPSRWNPKCLHLSGFARAQLLLSDSPYYTSKGFIQRLKNQISNNIVKFYFQRSTKFFFTENPYISDLLEKEFGIEHIYTVTNYYNQVFDQPEKWKERALPSFNGKTLLTISSWYDHKNLPIIIDVSKILKDKHPDTQFRFVVTVSKEEFPTIPDEVKDNILLIGKVKIEECPSLYQQSSAMFLPTLLECFSASYAEAMRMKRPIITTDLPFAHGLCGDSAEYYSPLSAEDAAEKIYSTLTNTDKVESMTSKGEVQLKNFDDYNSRTDKIIKIAEDLVNNKR